MEKILRQWQVKTLMKTARAADAASYLFHAFLKWSFMQVLHPVERVKNRPLQMLERDNLLAILVLFISGKVDR